MSILFGMFFSELTKEIEKYSNKTPIALNKRKLKQTILSKDKVDQSHDTDIDLYYIDAKTTETIASCLRLPCHYAMRDVASEMCDWDGETDPKFYAHQIEIEKADESWDKKVDDPLFYIITTWRVDVSEEEQWVDEEELFLQFLYTKSIVRDAFLWAGHVSVNGVRFAVTVMPSDINFRMGYVAQIYSRLFWEARALESRSKWHRWAKKLSPYILKEQWDMFNKKYPLHAETCDIRYDGHYPFDPKVNAFDMNPDTYKDKMKDHPRIQSHLGDQYTHNSYEWMRKAHD